MAILIYSLSLQFQARHPPTNQTCSLCNCCATFLQMIVDIEGLEVYFPYPYMYPEQFKYMAALRKTVAQRAHGLLEMPTGTGKTVCLLALLTSVQIASTPSPKLVYCTRTVQEMDKVIAELKRVITHRDQAYHEKYGNA